MGTAARLLPLILVAIAVPSSRAGIFSRAHPGQRTSKITLRKRLHVNTLITQPGTVEVDWSSLYSFSTANFAMPSAVKYTPTGNHIVWGRTEYSVAFDSITSSEAGGGRLTQFSQAVTLTAVSVLHDGEKLDIAVAPQSTFYLRDESGARLGALAIARYDSGRNSLGVTAGWSGATHSSPSNPSGTFDAGFGFGRQLAGAPWLGKLTPHFNAEWERSTGQTRIALAVEGIEYQITGRLAFDVAAQQVAETGTAPDRQIAVGITLNLGSVR